MRNVARKSRLIEIPQAWIDAGDEWCRLHPDVDPWVIISPRCLRVLREAKAAKAAAARPPKRKASKRSSR